MNHDAGGVVYEIAMKCITLATLLATSFVIGNSNAAVGDERPNILFAISDDQSWAHAGAYGDKQVNTPAFDRVAKAGVRFTGSFTACPSCAPSRAAILTGQDIFRLEEGGTLFGALPARFPVYPLMLRDAGYHTGYTGKANGPWNMKAGGWDEHPCGKAYQTRKAANELAASNIDYAANFIDFLDAKSDEDPFCFWYGAFEPHLAYKQGSGVAAGKQLTDVTVPEFLPDNDTVRGDILDYYLEIEHFDKHLGRMLDELEKRKLLDNTLVVVTCDNGIPLPRAKANLYEYGIHMPLAICWLAKFSGQRVVDDLTVHIDFAPTFLEAAGIEPPEEMTGRSLLTILTSELEGTVDPSRDQAFVAQERHSWCRRGGKPYPMRAVRTQDFLYIRNFESDRWPAGDPDFESSHQGFYGDADRCPTKTWMIEHAADNERTQLLFDLAFAKRVEEELYDIGQDPACMNNLAEKARYYDTLEQMRGKLDGYMFLNEDPRANDESPWDDYPYYFRDYWKRSPGANTR